MENASAKTFREVSEAVVNKVRGREYLGLGAPRGWQGSTRVWEAFDGGVSPQLESEYLKIPGNQIVSVVFIK